jgi:hypothetical protein
MLDEMKEKVLSELEDISREETYRAVNPMLPKMVLGYALTGADSFIISEMCPDKNQTDQYAPFKHIARKRGSGKRIIFQMK